MLFYLGKLCLLVNNNLGGIMKFSVHNLTKYYGSEKGILNINFALDKGKVLGVLGHNGSGKSTLFRTLLGLLIKDSGEIFYPSIPISQLFGYVPEERAVFKDLSVVEQLKFIGILKGVERKYLISKINYWIDRLGLGAHLNKSVAMLSKGNQQKVQFIGALLHEPKILILDEPLTGLDAVNVSVLKSIINEYCQKGAMVLLSSHQYEEVEEFCDDILLLKKGDPIISGALNDIKDQDGRRVVSFFEQPLKIRDEIVHKEKSGHLCHYTFENLDRAKEFVFENNLVDNRYLSVSQVPLRTIIKELME